MTRTVSVALITKNEEANLRRTLESVRWASEIVIVDSGSIDGTAEVAREFGAKFLVEPWRGFGAQKNFAIAQCTGEWVLSLDADEEVSPELGQEIQALVEGSPELVGSRRLLRECRTFVRHMDGKSAAAAGEHDDLVMAMGVALGAS